MGFWPIPPGLIRLGGTARGADWLRSLPGLVAACAERWDLRFAEAYTGSYASLVAPVRRGDGSEAVLKIQFPDPDSASEADALSLWDGEGAVRLLAHDRSRRALLLEPCEPGEPISNQPDGDALNVLIGFLPRLWRPATSPPFRTLRDQAETWAATLLERWERAGRPFERSLLDAALDALATLPRGWGSESVLLHQDLHPGNVLSARREPWLAIDATPLAGEREFGAVPLIRTSMLGHSRREVHNRLDRVSAELGLDRERVRLWSLVQALAWGLGSDYLEPRVEAARWLREG